MAIFMGIRMYSLNAAVNRNRTHGYWTAKRFRRQFVCPRQQTDGSGKPTIIRDGYDARKERL